MQRYHDWYRDNEGRAIAYGLVTVYVAGTTTLADIYNEQGAITTPVSKSNPFTTDADGYFSFAAAGGSYDISLSASSQPARTIANVALYDAVSDPNTNVLGLLQDSVDPTHGDALIAVKRIATGASATTVHKWIEAQLLNVQSDFLAVGDGVTDDYSEFALANASGSPFTIPPGTYRISSNLSVTVPVVFMAGAKLSIDSGKTVTFSSDVIAPSAQIFSGSGTVAGIKTLDAAWFGLVMDGDYATGAGTDNSVALQKAINAMTTAGGGSLDLPGGVMKVNATVTIPSGVDIRGKGKWGTIIFCPSAFSSTLIHVNGSGGYPTRLDNLGIIAQTGGAYSATGLAISKNGTFVDGLWLNGFGTGLNISNTDVFVSNFAIEQNTTGAAISSAHVNLVNGTMYGNAIGVAVSNGGSGEEGPVVLSDIRSSDDSQHGFSISNAKNVMVVNCSATASTNSKLTASGMTINGTSKYIQITNFAATVNGTTSVAGVGVAVANSSQHVELNNVGCRGFLDGCSITTSGESIRIVGGDYSYNGRHGINASSWSGGYLTISSTATHQNGTAGSATDCGITASMNSAYQRLIISEVEASQAGGGPQDYGVNIVCNDANSYGRVVNCICAFNAVSALTVTGTAAANVTNAGII